MMPLTMSPKGQEVKIIRIGGKDEVRRHLGELGFVAGGLTDGNRTAKFVPTLDALGVENYDEHTDHESVDLNTAVPRTAAFALTLAELAEVF